MSWQTASAALVVLAVLAGGGWYERSRPPARTLALVAALAALAVLGRIAFAPIPNVKPTTDIVLFAGYALGGAPGFAVGATTALVSNLFFGQGPWTPWQMAAWGGVGIMGAVLARVAGGRELGRVPLALACGAAGLMFGLVMDAFQWTLAAEETLASYVAISGVSLPFNVAHVVGNVLFCLLFGPPLVRALQRYRRRLEFTWEPPAAASVGCAVAALALVCALVAPAPAAALSSTSERAVRYLERAQNSDGGFGGAPRQSSNSLFTGWSALGLAAAGRNPGDVRASRRSIIDHMRANVRGLNDTGELERTILVLGAARVSPRGFGGRDLIAELQRRRRPDGSFEQQVNLTAFGVLALRAGGASAGAPPVRDAARWLGGEQNPDGGFGIGGASGSDPDSTGAVLQALAAAGGAGTRAVRRAVGYLRRVQHSDGGFANLPSGASNAQSTSWAVQGLVAAGRNPDRLRRSGRSPLAYLRSLQAADGSIRYSRTGAQTPVWVTAQALTALERAPFPLDPVARRRRPARVAEVAEGSARRGKSTRGRSFKEVAKDRRRPARAAGPAAEETTGPVAPAVPVLDIEPPADGAGAGASGGGSVTGGALALGGAAGLALGALWWRRRRSV